ncbi:hypothetical protein QYP01_23350 [Pseudomonas aeruginosa]|nr:hypothetical protein [Pseudomonas aeruginosa]
MPELATREFWKDLQPIPDCFKPDAKPEVYLRNAPTEDERLYLVAYEHEQPMRAFFIVKGPLVWLDEKGNADGIFDVHDYIAMCREHYDKIGVGAAYIDSLFR